DTAAATNTKTTMTTRETPHACTHDATEHRDDDDEDDDDTEREPARAKSTCARGNCIMGRTGAPCAPSSRCRMRHRHRCSAPTQWSSQPSAAASTQSPHKDRPQSGNARTP